jgi:hypothetical protein
MKWKIKVPDVQNICFYVTTRCTTGYEQRTSSKTESITSLVWTHFQSNTQCLHINTVTTPTTIVERHNSLQSSLSYPILHAKGGVSTTVVICCYTDVCNITAQCNYATGDAHYTNRPNTNFATVLQLDTSQLRISVVALELPSAKR